MDLKDINGIGEKTLKLLNKMDIFSVSDLLEHYPFRYNVVQKSDIRTIKDQDKVTLEGIIETVPSVVFYNRRKDKMKFKMNCYNHLFNVVIFNRGFLKLKLPVGSKITVIGKYEKRFNTIVASDIIYGFIENEFIEPVYHVVNGINSKQLNSLIVNNFVVVPDFIPDYLNSKYKFPSKLDCIREIHSPSGVQSLKLARLKLKYEELFLFMLKINFLKSKNSRDGLCKVIDKSMVKSFIDGLPFSLTSDQLSSVRDIYHDMIDRRQMNRLLQGDVGSGKTIVSFIALYMNFLAGYQGTLMAPTEILAIQHFNNICSLLPDLSIALLTGKTKAREKKDILNRLRDGSIDIIIGTHSLISDGVVYNNLGLVITDEQHRFGVNQRSDLKNKGINPDILYMSATPIPRTYALTIYGDMEVSSIKTMPNGRKPVVTLLKKDSEIKDVLSLMYKELKSGHQVYVIAPLIEGDSMENVYELESKMNRAFGKLYKVGILHGKMSNKEKEEVMNLYKDNKINILVSTTVIEVGIDVKNATVIVIFDSYRFGLSALHQLRGRVGRSSLESYCVLVSSKETERLNVLTETNDGFRISEADFKLRGSGDLFGIRQSGDMNFKLANIKNDFNILLKVKEDSKDFIKKYINSDKYLYIKNEISKSINLD